MANNKYKLSLTLTNGNTVDAGVIEVPQGEKGEAGASPTVDTVLRTTSNNPIANKPVAIKFANIDKLLPSSGTTGYYLKKTASGAEWAETPSGSGGGSAGVSSIGGETGDIKLGDGLYMDVQTLRCAIGSIRGEKDDSLMFKYMGDDDGSVPFGFYAPTTSFTIGSITPTEPSFDVEADVDIIAYNDVYLYERVTEEDTSKLIKNVTPLILTRGIDGFSGTVLMKAPALNSSASDVYFVMNVLWKNGETMLAQISGLRLDLRITNSEINEFVGHIIIPSAKWAEGIITFMPESLLASGLDYRELPAVFANQNSVYIFHQVWNNESFEGIQIERADTIDGTYSPVIQDNMSINIVPYSI